MTKSTTSQPPVLSAALRVAVIGAGRSDGAYASLALAGGGPLVGRGSHMAALIPWLTGWRTRAVTALLAAADWGVGDGGIVNVSTTSGAFFQIASVKTGYRNIDEVEVIGTAGGVRVERVSGQSNWTITHLRSNDAVMPPGELPPGRTTTDHFVDVVLGRAANRIPTADGLASVEIIEAAYESARTGQTILANKPSR